jgi:hypothetical protein
MLREFREKNREQDMSGVRVILDPDEEPVPIKEVVEYSLYLMEIAMMTEVEAFLVEFLKQNIGMDEDRINAIVQDLRKIMYKTEETT